MFSDSPEGLRIKSLITWGTPDKKYKSINKYLIDSFCYNAGRDAYLRHIIEETGNLQFWLPTIFRHYAVAPATPAPAHATNATNATNTTNTTSGTSGYRRQMMDEVEAVNNEINAANGLIWLP